MKEKILVSACLAGCPCRYDGKSNEIAEIRAMVEAGQAIPFCPEVEGGMPTPRIPSEIKENKVYNREGQDVTDYFKQGAHKALQVCRKAGIKKAVLKSKSPSCGSQSVYDGSFSGNLIAGKGITAEVLEKNGISVVDENEFLKGDMF